MNLGAVIGITGIVIFISLYEWPKMGPTQKKEKASFITFTALGWILAVLLLFIPDLPGPTQLVRAIFKPLEKILER